jgi:hypothetical protein
VIIRNSISDTTTLGGTANRPDGTPAGGFVVFIAYFI